MGVCLALSQIDHKNIVLRGLPVLNRALQTGNLKPLRQLLKRMPFEESKELATNVRARIAALKKLKAPPMIIDVEKRRLLRASRPKEDVIDRATVDELRNVLGRWNSECRTLDLDKSHDLLHWYCDPSRRRREEGDWRWRRRKRKPSAFDYALHGYQAYPLDAAGQPVIKTGGMPDSSWYNPPEVVGQIASALAQVSINKWGKVDAAMSKSRYKPYCGDSKDRLEYAKGYFERFRVFYENASRRGFAVSVEYY
jgi:hypothetical protein